MGIMQAIREYVATCPYLDSLTGGVHMDWLVQGRQTDYGVHNGGDMILNTYMNGDHRKQQTFYIQSALLSDSDVMRLQNSDMIEDIQNWFNDRQFKAFPLPDNCDFERIAVGNGAPFDVSEDGTVFIYRITGNLIYERMV